jgi:hypothetical protein
MVTAPTSELILSPLVRRVCVEVGPSRSPSMGMRELALSPPRFHTDAYNFSTKILDDLPIFVLR